MHITHARHPSSGARFAQASIVAATALLAGCATVVDIADRHNDANLVQEQVVNRQLLLNVVRAMHRQPLHFSRIPFIRLPLVQSAPWEFTLPFGDVGSYTRNSAKTSVGGQLITIEVSPQDGQEFIQGLTTPVKASLMDLYFQQGWPQQLVLYLFVEEMRLMEQVGDKVEVRERYRNHPGHLEDFRAAIDVMTEHCDLVVVSSPGPQGPRLAYPWAGALSGLPEAVTAGLIGAGDIGGTLALQLPGKSGMKLVPTYGADASKCLPTAETEKVLTGTSLPKPELAMRAMRAGGAAFFDPSPKAMPSTGTGDKKPWLEITLRSPDGMVYYLGEVLRSGGAVTVKRNGSGKRGAAVLFNAAFTDTRTPAPEKAAVWVDYWDRRYAIVRPDSAKLSNPDDRSMQTLALLGQVLQLQNKATSPPRGGAPLRVEP
jgi:hypothetical protein